MILQKYHLIRNTNDFYINLFHQKTNNKVCQNFTSFKKNLPKISFSFIGTQLEKYKTEITKKLNILCQ